MKRDIPYARPLSPEEYSQWDVLVEESPQGSIFSKSNYLQILARASDSRLRIIGCLLDGDLIGGCPLLERRRRFLGVHAVSSGSCTPFSGFIYQTVNSKKILKNEVEYNACVKALIDYLRDERYASVSIANSPELLDIRPFLRHGWNEKILYTYYISLGNLSLNDMSSSIKKSTKLAKARGLFYEQDDDIHSHYQVLTKVFQHNNGIPPFDEIYYDELLRFFQSTKTGDQRVVKDQSGEILASYLWVWDTKRAYAWSGGAVLSPEYRDGTPNKFIFYCFLEELKEMGFKEVNIMHANTPRLTHFATGFNPYLKPYYTVGIDRRTVSCLRNIKIVNSR